MTSLLTSLLVFIIVTIVTPGAANLLAAASGAQVGLRSSLGLLSGIAGGVIGIVALVGVGVGAVVASQPALSLGLRILGSAYLLWLAYQIARSGRPDLETARGVVTWRTGFLLTLVNPKTWTVALSAAAGYSDLSSEPWRLAAILAAAFTIVVIPNLLLWCVGGEMVGRRLSTDTHWRRLNLTLAALLVASIGAIWIG
jgi:threonine/homoserine/homoserine lactone efflux protein